MVISFIEGFLFSLSLCFDLGMVNVAIMKMGINRGFKPSFMIGLGSCFGDLIYLALVLVGFSFIFEFLIIKWVLWILGTLVLLYLTFKMFHETIKPKMLDVDEDPLATPSLLRQFIFGVGIALSSPTSIIWFAVVGGPIVAGMVINDKNYLISFIFGFFVAGLMWSLFLAITSSQTGRLLGKKIIRGISLISALLFLYFAIKVFIEGLRTVINS